MPRFVKNLPASKPRAKFVNLNAPPTGAEVVAGYRDTYQRARAAGDISVMRAVEADLRRLGISVTDTDDQRKG
jgi:hypothetical protein